MITAKTVAHLLTKIRWKKSDTNRCSNPIQISRY